MFSRGRVPNISENEMEVEEKYWSAAPLLESRPGTAPARIVSPTVRGRSSDSSLAGGRKGNSSAPNEPRHTKVNAARRNDRERCPHPRSLHSDCNEEGGGDATACADKKEPQSFEGCGPTHRPRNTHASMAGAGGFYTRSASIATSRFTLSDPGRAQRKQGRKSRIPSTAHPHR